MTDLHYKKTNKNSPGFPKVTLPSLSAISFILSGFYSTAVVAANWPTPQDVFSDISLALIAGNLTGTIARCAANNVPADCNGINALTADYRNALDPNAVYNSSVSDTINTNLVMALGDGIALNQTSGELTIQDSPAIRPTISMIESNYLSSEGNVTFTNQPPSNDSYVIRGGILSTISLIGTQFIENPNGAIQARLDSSIYLSGTTFTNNGVNTTTGGAVNLTTSALVVQGSTFETNSTSTSGGAINALGTYLNISGTTFEGNTAQAGGAVFVDADNNSAITSIFANAVFKDNRANNGAALAIQNAATTQISNSSFDGNSSTNNGGAISSISSNLSITADASTPTIFSNNSANTGGAIYVLSPNPSTTSIVNTNFNQNSSLTQGGAVYFDGATNGILSITNAAFTNNTAVTNGGGALISQASSATITNSSFNNNSAQQNGGGLIAEGSLGGITISADVSTPSTFNSNTAVNGGGIFISSQSATIGDTIFTANQASGNGGGIFIDTTDFASSSIAISDSSFSDNQATNNGGALYGNILASTLTDLTFTNNSAAVGGAISLQSFNSSNHNIADSSFSNNHAINGNGGAVSLDSITSATLTNTTYTQNSATGDGGALFVNNTGLTLTADASTPSNFNANTAVNGGAIALYGNGGLTTIENAVFTDNTASGSGGAIYSNNNSFNLLAQNGATSLFAGNTATNAPSSVFIQSDTSTTMNVDVDSTSTVDMQDPMASSGSAPLSINKNNSGTWRLAGTNALNSLTNFSVKEGSLYLYKAATIGSNSFTDGIINLPTANSTFTLGTPTTTATLIAGGTTNAVNTAGAMTFNTNSIIRGGTGADGSGQNIISILNLNTAPASGAVVLGTAPTDTLFFSAVQSGDNFTVIGDLTGPGGLTKNGDGTVNLNGTSTYSGDTEVAFGTLTVDGQINSPTHVAVGAVLGVLNSPQNNPSRIGSDVSIDGNLNTAAGQLATMDSLVFSSTGVFQVTLGAPSGNPLLSVNGNLTLDGSLSVIPDGSSTYGAGVYRLINYTGAITNNGMASPADTSIQTAIPNQVNLVNTNGLTLNFWDGSGPFNNNRVDGGTGTWSALNQNWTIADGSLDSTYTNPSMAIFQTLGGTVTIDNSDGIISALGLQFAADNYQLNGDTLTLVNDNTIRVGDGTTASAGYTATINTEIAGSVGLNKTDFGRLILGGTNTYSGTTTLTRGVLQLNGSIVGDAVANSGLFQVSTTATVGGDAVVNPGAIFQVAGAVTGNATTNGGLFQVGTTGAIASDATINAGGLLQLDGSVAGTVLVNTNGLLQGNGSMGNLVVNGTISPGNSIGTLTINGNFIQNPGSIYNVEINNLGQSDRINVLGSATINGGTVNLAFAPETFILNTEYTIVTALGGVSGVYDFTSQDTGQPFLSFALRYDPNNVYLDLIRSAVPFASFATTFNEINTANALDALAQTNPLSIAVASIGSPTRARAAYNALSGEVYASALTSWVEDSHYLRDSVLNRLYQAGSTASFTSPRGTTIDTTANGMTFWTQGFGAWGDIDTDGNAATLERQVQGVFLGADNAIGDARLGVVAGYQNSNYSVSARNSSIDGSTYQLGLYGSLQHDAFVLRLGGAYAWQTNESRRNLSLPNFSNQIKASYNGNTSQFFAETGYDIPLSVFSSFEPFANVAYVHATSDTWQETGGAAALNGQGSSDAVFSTLGMRESSLLTALEYGNLFQKITLGWRHAYSGVTPIVEQNFIGSPSAFTIAGTPLSEDSLIIDAGFTLVNYDKNINLRLSYVGQMGNSSQDHALAGTLSWAFA